MVGLSDVYVCPRDGIAHEICVDEFPMKPFSNITQSTLEWKDVVIYMLIGPNSKLDAFHWWLQFVKTPMTFVIVADSCPNANATCADSATALQTNLLTSRPLVKTEIVRVNPWDNGYKVLSCKLRTGLKRIYERYPDRKYYFKVDTDSLLLPHRFFSFLNTLHAISLEHVPYYFGTVTESGMGLILCGNHPDWANKGPCI